MNAKLSDGSCTAADVVKDPLITEVLSKRMAQMAKRNDPTKLKDTPEPRFKKPSRPSFLCRPRRVSTSGSFIGSPASPTVKSHNTRRHCRSQGIQLPAHKTYSGCLLGCNFNEYSEGKMKKHYYTKVF